MQFASSKLCIAVKTTLYQSFSSALQVRIYASSKLCIVVKTTLYQCGRVDVTAEHAASYSFHHKVPTTGCLHSPVVRSDSGLTCLKNKHAAAFYNNLTIDSLNMKIWEIFNSKISFKLKGIHS